MYVRNIAPIKCLFWKISVARAKSITDDKNKFIIFNCSLSVAYKTFLWASFKSTHFYCYTFTVTQLQSKIVME